MIVLKKIPVGREYTHRIYLDYDLDQLYLIKSLFLY